ncbi:MAG: TIM barrel protein [Candidatus Thorarchaeota archaeon]
MTFPTHRAYHVIYDRSLEDALRYASNNNWTGIVPDISVPRFSPERISIEERMMLRELSVELSLEWGFHAPGDDVSLFTSYAPIREAILQYFKQIIDLARDVSTNEVSLVIHAGTPPSFRKSGESIDAFSVEHHDYYLELICKSLETLIQYGSPQVQIVLENYNWTPLVVAAIEILVPEGLRLCLDIPKLYDPEMRLKTKEWTVFEHYKESIEVVHVHDCNTLGSHQSVGDGTIDFTETLHFLSGLKHNPLYVFEVRPREAAQQSLIAFTQLLDGF